MLILIYYNIDTATEVICHVCSLGSHDDPDTTLSEIEQTLAMV